MTEAATIESYRAHTGSEPLEQAHHSTPSRGNSGHQQSTQTTQTEAFGEGDRAGLSFFISILVHMVIILGVTFALPKLKELEGLPTLEITLVQTNTSKAPEKSDYLAQANQQGGGTTARPETAMSPLPITEIGESSITIPVQQAMPRPMIKSEKEQTELLASKNSNRKVRQTKSMPDKQDRQTMPANPGILKNQQYLRERSRLNAQLSRQWNEFQQLPRRKYINARTREYKYAAYMVSWQAKVERVGNINYPEEARRRGLSGDLVLDVVLAANGSLDEVKIIRSSGYKLLDDAAMRIVALSAPFQPFPENIRQETDLLHITRTWKFNEQGWRGQK